jgi:hypothetical protein
MYKRYYYDDGFIGPEEILVLDSSCSKEKYIEIVIEIFCTEQSFIPLHLLSNKKGSIRYSDDIMLIFLN